MQKKNISDTLSPPVKLSQLRIAMAFIRRATISEEFELLKIRQGEAIVTPLFKGLIRRAFFSLTYT